VRVDADTIVRVIARFEDYPGRFPYHCHLLDHEDHEMMRQFQTVNDSANCDNDGFCEAGEDAYNCSNDCGIVGGSFCGNGLCEVGDGEDCLTCAIDCAGEQTGGGEDYCCGSGGTNPIGCGIDATDDRCIDGEDQRFCRMTPRLVASCGDHLCEGQETVANCAQDCSVPFCEATEITNEVSCGDGLDNDCDGATDTADTDCQPDTDSDGIPDDMDNCTLIANGPLLPDAGGNSQLDTDGDNYGNACDADLNNDLVINGLDVGPFTDQFGTVGPHADFNGDGVVNGLDVGPFVDMFGQAPGPSGLAP
jgi:hypothetical protein